MNAHPAPGSAWQVGSSDIAVRNRLTEAHEAITLHPAFGHDAALARCRAAVDTWLAELDRRIGRDPATDRNGRMLPEETGSRILVTGADGTQTPYEVDVWGVWTAAADTTTTTTDLPSWISTATLLELHTWQVPAPPAPGPGAVTP
jgi:hypothetical protein